MLSQQLSENDASAAEYADRDHFARLAGSRNAPNLIVIGAMKASTTTFYELITRHPNIWFSSEKEPHYFTSPNYGEPAARDAYLKLFDATPTSAKYIGEASTGYSKLPHFGDTPQRLRDALDHPVFIYLVRDPVERTVSNYQHAYLSGHYAPGTTLAQAVEQDPILVDASCYARQIQAYHDVFGPDRLLTITTNDLHAHPATVMQRVEQFLDLPAYKGWDTQLQQSNSKQALGRSVALQSALPQPLFNLLRKLIPTTLRGKLKQLGASTPELPEITVSDRQLVFDRVADDLRELQTILGDEIAGWPSVQKLGESQTLGER